MDAPKTTRCIVRKKLCLKSTLDTCEYDPVENVYFHYVVTTPQNKQATVPPKVDDDDDLADFKSPTKTASKPEKVVKSRPRMPTRPSYSYPNGCSSTQEMLAKAWMRAGVGQTEYLSENEFEDFKDERKREELLRSKAEYINSLASANIEESPIPQTEQLNSSEAKPTPLEPIPSCMNGGSVESGEANTPVENSSQQVTNADSATSPPTLLHTHFSSPNGIATSNYKKKSTDSLRTELRKMKIKNVIIAESDLSEDEVVCSQIPSSKKLKTIVEDSLRQNGELESSKDLKADEEILCATESASLEPELASLSTPLNTLPLYKIEAKNNENVYMDALPTVDKLTKEEAQFEKEPTPNLQNAEIHLMHNTPPSIKLPLQLSILQSTESEWRVQNLSYALKPSRRNLKATINYKKSRLSFIRSLRWKMRTYKQKYVSHLI